MRRGCGIVLLSMATVLVADAIGAGVDEQVVARATSSVVAVDAGLQGSGSAVCVDASGLFVTNRHVVDAFGAAGTVRLVIDAGTDRARSVEARVINTAMEDDLALLRTVDPVPNLRPMPIARASDIRVTEPVAALGFPGGQGRDAVGSEWPPCTVTFGNLTERQMQDDELRFLSFDATIYPGNSGGALINRDGELIGVVTMTLQAGGRHLGVNGAVSVNRVRRFLEQPPLYGEFETIEYRRRFDEHTATLHFEPDRNIEGPVEVKLIVGPPGNERVYPAETEGAGKYTCRFHPFAPDKPVPVRLQPARRGERLVQDGPIRVGNLELRLSDLAETHGDRVQLVSGQILYGAVSGDLTLLDSSGADVGRFALPDERCRVEAPGQVPFQIEARTGRQLLGRSRGALALPTHTPSQIVRPSNPRPFSLPGRILHVDVGGGGEVLAIVVAGETKVRLFDMARGRWWKSVEVGQAVKAPALGRNLLAVVGEDVGAIHIFDWRRNRRGRSIDVRSAAEAMGSPAWGRAGVVQLGIGADADGPVYAFGGGPRVIAFDPETGRALPRHPGAPPGLWPSPDGEHLASPSAVEHGAKPNWMAPADHGRLILTDRGIYMPEHGRRDPTPWRPAHSYLPTASDRWIAAVVGVRPWHQLPGRQVHAMLLSTADLLPATVYLNLRELRGFTVGQGFTKAADDPRSATGEEQSSGSMPIAPPSRGSMGLERRLFFSPEAGRLTVIPSSNDRIVHYRVPKPDVKDRPVPAALPPRVAREGTPYRHEIRLTAGWDQRDVRFRLIHGPPGMSVTEAGSISWAEPVPPDTGQGLDGSAHPVLIAMESDRPVHFLSYRLHVEPASMALEATVSEPKVVTFQAPVAAMSLAAGGRRLVVQPRHADELLVLDLSSARVERRIPLAHWRVRFAAGADHLIAIDYRAGSMEAWNLETGRTERTQSVAFDRAVTAAAMGAADARYLAVATRKGMRLYDGKTLARLQRPGLEAVPGPMQLHASPDGSTLLAFDHDDSAHLVLLNDDRVDVTILPADRHHSPLIPSHDGAHIAHRGLWIPTSELGEAMRADRHQRRLLIPAVDGDLAIEVAPDSFRTARLVMPADDAGATPDLPVLTELSDRSRFPLHERVILTSRPGRLVILGNDDRSVYVRRIDGLESARSSKRRDAAPDVEVSPSSTE